MNIKSKISESDIKKILGNSKNKKTFLNKKQITFKTTDNKDKLDKLIIENWNYGIDKKLLREMYFKKNEYLKFEEYEKIKKILVDEWEYKFGDEISWPFSQGKFDEYIQRKHNSYSISDYKDNDKMDALDLEVAKAAQKFRRIKQLNIIINDYIEKLIIESNEEIIPTYGNKKGVDFYINGEAFDQKISKSPTKEFIKKYENELGGYKEFAKKNPAIVAEFLYRYQDEERFGKNKRLLVVFLDKKKANVDLSTLRTYVDQFEKLEPYEVKFKYKHKTSDEKEYKTKAYVILI